MTPLIEADPAEADVQQLLSALSWCRKVTKYDPDKHSIGNAVADAISDTLALIAKRAEERAEREIEIAGERR